MQERHPWPRTGTESGIAAEVGLERGVTASERSGPRVVADTANGNERWALSGELPPRRAAKQVPAT